MGTSPPGYQTQSPDTSYEAEQVLLTRVRDMGDLGRLRRAWDLTELTELVARAELRARFPDATPRELRMHLAARRFDRATMIRVWGWDPALGRHVAGRPD